MQIPLMIDSGAFSALYRKIEIKLDDYIAFCKDITPEFPQAVFVNLDVINKGPESYRNWRIMLDAGVNALPVYHVTTDVKWLLKYLKRTDYISIGAIGKSGSLKRRWALDRLWEAHLIDPDTRLPRYKVHGLGLTSFPLIARYPWFSVDSTSWIRVAMFGHIHVPKRRGGEWDYAAPPTKVGFSNKSSDNKIRGKHVSNLSPTERGEMLRYLKAMGFRLGFECPIEGTNKRAVLDGVSTFHGRRAELTLEFFAGYMKTLPWPRPLESDRTARGFGL